MAASTAKHKLLSRMISRGLGALPVSAFIAGLVGCGGDATSPSAAPETFWTLRFNQHVAQLALTAPQNTIQLTATPLTVDGRTPVGLGPVQYATADSAVTVSATGLVTADSVTFQNAVVVATVTDTVHHVTLQDTCWIQVTDVAPSAPLSSFTLQSTSGDTLPPGADDNFSTIATDANGNTVTTLAYFTSADLNIAQIDKLGGTLTGKRTGQVMIYAETWAYGVAKRDSFLLNVGFPLSATIYTLPVTPTGSTQAFVTFWPQFTAVHTGALVTWVNESYTDTADVVFDDPANVDSSQFGSFYFRFATGHGNIAPWVWDTLGTAPDSVSARMCGGYLQGGITSPCHELLNGTAQAQQRRRLFPVAGTYHYHSAKWGTTGTIVVQ